MGPNQYSVHTVEPDAPRNIDELGCDDAPPCPLCGSAYVGILSHHGPRAAWVECFLGHCIRLDWDAAGHVFETKLTDKPRYTISFTWSTIVLGRL